MHALAILFAGFSIFTAVPTGAALWRGNTGSTRLVGACLLLALVGLQLLNFLYLQYHNPLLYSPVYRILLFSVAPCFYLFSRPILLGKEQPKGAAMLHFLPAAGAAFLPFHLAIPLSFLVGAGYLVWLAHKLFALRGQRPYFRRELALLGSIFTIALLVTLLGVLLPKSHEQLFFTLYTIAIGLAFLLLSLTLTLTPSLTAKLRGAVQETYSNTTLQNVDCEAALQKLDELMFHEQLFRQSDLNLASLASRLNLSRHQFSELINTRLGLGFSRYLREQRVAEARQLLLDKPSLPVLSVGMEAGFSSQSAFYDAFREITGMTPGKYRELHKKSPAH